MAAVVCRSVMNDERVAWRAAGWRGRLFESGLRVVACGCQLQPPDRIRFGLCQQRLVFITILHPYQRAAEGSLR